MADNMTEKLHAACDGCRTRKLKCSGETQRCSRCSKEGIRCVYSPQKPMGRPRKRRREADAVADQPQPLSLTHEPASSFSGPNFDIELAARPELDNFAGVSHVQADGGPTDPFFYPPNLNDTYAQGPIPDIDFEIDPTLDPSLWETQPTSTKDDAQILLDSSAQLNHPCACLSIMYLTLTELQTMSSFSFPGVVPPLRRAMDTASTIMRCDNCPKDTFGAIQNVLTLNSMFIAIAERFHRVLKEIDHEADRLYGTGEKKPYRISDCSLELKHLHTGTSDCPMGFQIQLDSREWQKMAKKALKAEVLGGGTNPHAFSSLVDQMEERQRKWHCSHDDEERARIFGDQKVCKSRDDALCIQMVHRVRKMISNMVWG